MSKAMQSIVDTYVALSRPEALQELQSHRLKLIGNERSGFDLFREQIEDELNIIRAGLAKLAPPGAAQQAVEQPDGAIGNDAPLLSDEPEAAPIPVILSTEVRDEIALEPVAPVAPPPPNSKPALYGFPPAGIAMPILAAAIFSKNALPNEPAIRAIQLNFELAKRSTR